MSRRLRFAVLRTSKSPEGRHAWALGVRVGYWPCLRGPHITINIGTRRYYVWYGLPSYAT
jgi:hypothetical protein